MKHAYKKKPGKDIREAKKKIIEYFKLAKDSCRANDYIRKARKLAMKFKIRLTSAQQKKFCKHCYSYLVPGKNLRVRTQGSKVVYYCLECKKYMRFPFVREKKLKRQKK